MLVLIFGNTWYKNNCIYNFTKIFAKIIATINPIILACFFETIFHDIFKSLLVNDSKYKELFNPVSTYFGMVKINNQEMLYLQY